MPSAVVQAPAPSAPQASAPGDARAHALGVSPLAASVFSNSPWPERASAPQSPRPSPPFAPGARVLVQWADGNRYPAVVQQISGVNCLVCFPDGRSQWVLDQYLFATP